MTRQKKPVPAAHKVQKKVTFVKVPHKDQEGMSFWKPLGMVLCLFVAVYVGYMGYLETRVNTPFDDKKMVIKSGLDVPDRYWGSYRPGVYFGMKTRDPHSLVTGLMWYFPRQLRYDGSNIRHWCEQGDNLDRYGWTEHDGRTFGIQEIVDGQYLLTTTFVKRPGGNHGGDWTARISVTTTTKSLEGEPVSLLLYTALEEKGNGHIRPTSRWALPGVSGQTEGLGSFTIKVFDQLGRVDRSSYLSTASQGLHLLKESIMAALQVENQRISLSGDVPLPAGEEPSLVVTQVTGRVPLELDVVFESASVADRPGTLTGQAYTDLLRERRQEFRSRFESTFRLAEKGYNAEDVSFARAALSNMLGGVGYFHGTSRVESPSTGGPVPYWKAPLYTAVPSRSFFPRGFLWDEGFHGLLLSAWDTEISLDIICHWFDLMNVEGWIPREQILGSEALARVPQEFVTQRNSNANPPTFFLTLRSLLSSGEANTAELSDTLVRLFPRLDAWFRWFNTSQAGDFPGSYRWRGRDATTNLELNPKTLTSGLDDYPRASHPNIDERHVDLHCWLAMAADTMARVAALTGSPRAVQYEETFTRLSNGETLDEMHWSARTGAFADYGLHTDSVVLRRPPPPPPSEGRSKPPASTEKVRVVLQEPELRLVDSTFGYVSLFPLLLQLLRPDSPRLGKLLEDLPRTDLLWTEYGLRSLAKTSPLYMKRNTEHDPPYWRGQVWLNVNYLAARALHHYGGKPGPHREKARALYAALRAALVGNVMREYRRTGYVWEQYNDATGNGRGSRPFTGWSALTVLLMAERY